VRVIVCLPFDTDLLEQLDRAREDVPRSRFVERVVRSYLGEIKAPKVAH